MDEHDWLAERFEEHRTHLRAVAYRMLGSVNDADDAVQESWLRLSRSDTTAVQNLGGWLTTVVARVSLDMLRSRAARREDHLGTDLSETGRQRDQRVWTRNTRRCWPIRSAARCWWCWTRSRRPSGWRSCCTTCSPCRSTRSRPSSGAPRCGQTLASRARHRVQGTAPAAGTDRNRQRELVDAFLAAARGGDFAGLLALLDPEAVLRADHAAVAIGAASEVRGARGVAETFSGRARAARLALVDGMAGAVWSAGGQPRVVFAFTITDGKIAGIDLLADPARLSEFEVEFLEN